MDVILLLLLHWDISYFVFARGVCVVVVAQMTASNIEVAVVGDDKKFRVLTADEVKDYLEETD